MLIYGLQKLSLLDYPGKVACTVFLGGCDFRCPYCHNALIAGKRSEPVMDEGELMAFLQKNVGRLDGVAISGGEPLMDEGLPTLLRRIKGMGFLVKLDTNGNHPESLEGVMEDRLVDYVAMDVKNCPWKYPLTVGIAEVDIWAIRRSAELLMGGGVEYEFRTTVVDELHDVEDFREIGEWIRGAKKYALQGFVDRPTVPFAGLHAPAAEKMAACVEAARPYVERLEMRG